MDIDDCERSWTPERVIVRLKELHIAGEAIDYTSLEQNHARLFEALMYYFGSWQRAILVAGFDPDGDWPGKRNMYGRRYSAEEVIRFLIIGTARGDKLTGQVIRYENWGMLCSGEEHFGSWNNARLAAGLRTTQESWSRDRVVTTLQVIKANGGQINHRHIADTYPRLEGAIRRYFDIWEEAVKAAGFDPGEERLARLWTDEEIITRIKERKDSEQSIGYVELQEDDSSLLGIMVSHFGSWSAAVRQAGFYPEVEQSHEIWSADRVLQELKSRKQRGEPINYTALPGTLVGAIRRYFRLWSVAVKESGFDPEEERIYQVWSRDKIIFELRKLKAEGKSIYRTALPGNVGQALDRDFFESWEDAVRAAGFDPEKEVPAVTEQAKRTNATIAAAKTIMVQGKRKYKGSTRRYSSEEVLQWIRDRRDAGEKVTQQAAQRSDRYLVYSANDHFGSWGKALTELGIAPAYGKWSQTRVIIALQEIKRNGGSINRSDLVRNHPTLEGGMKRHFNSWEEAVYAAGFNPEDERKHVSWDADVVIEELKRLKRDGTNINPSTLTEDYRSLYQAMTRFYGTWSAAVEAAGYDPSEEARRPGMLA